MLEISDLEEEGLYYPCSKTKALISFAVTVKLICVFVFAYANRMFSHNEAHITTVNQFFVANYFHLFVFIFVAIIFADCRNGPCKNNVQYVYMNIFAAIYYHKFLFLAKTVT